MFNTISHCFFKINQVNQLNKKINELTIKRADFFEKFVNNRWCQAAVVLGGIALAVLGLATMHQVSAATYAYVLANTQEIWFAVGLSLIGVVTVVIPLAIAAVPVALVAIGAVES